MAARLVEAHAAINTEAARELALDLLRADLSSTLDTSVTYHRQVVVETIENWWDKYAFTLRDTEQEREAASVKLDDFLAGLGYAG